MNIEFHSDVFKQLQRLPKTATANESRKIISLGNDPRPDGVVKLAGSSDYRVRVGEYRIIYSIDEARDTVSVLWVGTRQEAYT